jgi:hypothetical protein
MIPVDYQNQLIAVVRRVIEPDLIFVLGSTYNNKRTESIFDTSIKGAEYLSEYFVLILKSNDSKYTVTQLQDRIEELCQTIVGTTCLVFETAIFKQWLCSGHSFARTVLMSTVPIYHAGNIRLSFTG